MARDDPPVGAELSESVSGLLSFIDGRDMPLHIKAMLGVYCWQQSSLRMYTTLLFRRINMSDM